MADADISFLNDFSMNARIRITQPCSANWDEMTPAADGRHCALCSKTVTDFTGWETEEIIAYLQQNTNREVCGRITDDQAVAQTPTRKQQIKAIWRSKTTIYQRIAAAILLFFSIENLSHAQARQTVTGTPQHQAQSDYVMTRGIVSPTQRDTSAHKRVIMGKPAPIKHKPVTKKPQHIKPAAEPQPEITQGMIQEVIPPSSKQSR